MLYLHQVNNPDGRKVALAGFLNLIGQDKGTGSQAVTWIVSDLRSKFEVQEELIKKRGHFQDREVLRASEFWRLLLRRIDPEYRVVSADLIRARVLDQLDSLNLQIGAGADKTICDFMEQMSPILFHPQGPEKMQEWFEENPESEARWGSWYKIAANFSVQFVNEKFIAPRWVGPLLLRLLPNYLQTKELKNIWASGVIFDLGSEMSQVEGDLIAILQESISVQVLAPAPDFAKKYKLLLSPYELLRAKANQKELPVTGGVQLGVTQNSYRFSSMLAEVKHVTSQVRSWLEAGIAATEIVVMAPDIEVYWPILSLYLQTEGIDCNKEVSTRIQNIPVIAKWWSHLKIRTGQIDSSSLEVATYDLNKNESSVVDIRYDEFRALFKNLIDPEDISRHSGIARAFAKEIDLQESVNVDEFLAQALRYWPNDQTSDSASESSDELLEMFLKEILGKTDSKQKLLFSSWLFYCERILAKKEVRLLEKSPQGLVLTNILSGDALRAKRRIFLGLSEGQLLAKVSAVILPKEISSFNSKFGFFIQNPESSQVMFELEWLKSQPSEEDHFCFPMSHFDGTLQNPSQFWLDIQMHNFAKKGLEYLDLPSPTRWDEQQAKMVEHYQEQVQQRSQERLGSGLAPLDQRLRTLAQDAGVFPWTFTPPQSLPSLSASSLERIRNCGFVFFSEKLLRLRDLPEIDLDLDRRTKGSLAHALLEKLLAPPVRYSWSEAELCELIEGIRVEIKLSDLDPVIWQGIKFQHLSLAKKFLVAEKAWADNYPKSRNFFRELAFKFSHAGFDFSGKLDRVDGDDDGRVVLIDYKMSDSSVKPFGSWFKENTLQLAFYSWAVEQGYITELRDRSVVAAFYYVLKNMDRSQGFKLKPGFDHLYDGERRKAQVDQMQKEKMILDLGSEVAQVVEKIRQGAFAPEPRDVELCQTCSWSQLCRAPHLI